MKEKKRKGEKVTVRRKVWARTVAEGRGQLQKKYWGRWWRERERERDIQWQNPYLFFSASPNKKKHPPPKFILSTKGLTTS